MQKNLQKPQELKFPLPPFLQNRHWDIFISISRTKKHILFWKGQAITRSTMIASRFRKVALSGSLLKGWEVCAIPRMKKWFTSAFRLKKIRWKNTRPMTGNELQLHPNGNYKIAKWLIWLSLSENSAGESQIK